MSRNLPLVTVISGTYNLIKSGRKEFFKKCVESLLCQTYPNIEYLIIDGASSDGTLNLFDEMNFPKNTTIISEPDTGMWNAMNKGIKKAKGKYICFLNSDDFYVTDTIIADCIAQLEETNSDYSVANYMVIQLNGEVANEWCKNIKPCPREYFYRCMTYNHETLICRKDVYERLGLHDEKYKTAADYYFNIRLVFAACTSVYIDKVMIAARVGGETVNANGEFSSSTLINVANIWNDMFPWCNFTPELTNAVLSRRLFPYECLKKIKEKIIAMQLKNFDYNIFIDDIDAHLKLAQHYENMKTILTYLKSKNIAYKILKCLTLYKKKKYPRIEDRFIHFLDKRKIMFNICLRLATTKEKIK